MPLPMVHLTAAVRMHELRGGAPSPAFLLGSLAPDAIHMRLNATRDDKWHTHLLDTHDSDQECVRKLLAPYQFDDPDTYHFAKGYAAHVLTDRLWYRTVIVPLETSLSPALSAQELRSLYYLEADQLDFNLYYRVPWRAEVWAKLASARPIDFASLLTAAEIEQWRDRTLDWFEKIVPQPKIEPVHITDELVQVFIDRAAETVARNIPLCAY